MRRATARLRARLSRPNPDVPGTMLDALEHRVGDDTQALIFQPGVGWSAMTYDGEASATGDTLAELLSNFLPQLPLQRA